MHGSDPGPWQRDLFSGAVGDDDGLRQSAADDCDERLAVSRVDCVRFVVAYEGRTRKQDRLKEITFAADLPDGAQVWADEIADVANAMAGTALQ